eukprot:GFUD01039353.1.p1 GENE.GFUD01039353.1~~GFUD01039353.1.p1  ORF type:complete len:265 (-),score=80.74 GFUD01039353.1:314-1108(-)
MKNIALLSIAGLALLQPAVEAIFFGPIAVGAVLGALAVGKGFILGSLLSSRRSRRQSYRQRRSYTPYRRQHHYNPQPSYYHHYTKPKTYYYSSNHHSYRGKRFAPEISMAEIERYKREVVDKIMTDDWYMEMVEKDQDDCTKRLICETSHKKAGGGRLNSIEEGVMDIFGKGQSVDTSKSTAIFDFAAQAGKYWKAGGVGCEFYRRCDTPITDILEMIETELDDFAELEKSMKGSKDNAEDDMKKEKFEVEEMLNSLDSELVLQ